MNTPTSIKPGFALGVMNRIRELEEHVDELERDLQNARETRDQLYAEVMYLEARLKKALNDG